MSSMKSELRRMILKEMRKREFGETKNPDWNNSNSRLLDIINEEMTAQQAEMVTEMSTVPEDEFSVWNPDEPEPMDYDWGIVSETFRSGIPVSEEQLDSLTGRVADVLNTPLKDMGGRVFSPALGNILGRLASTIESIKSNTAEAGRGAMGMDDVAVLRNIATGPDADVLDDEEQGELLGTINQMLQGVA